MEQPNDRDESWNHPTATNSKPENKKIACGILAILVGYLGIHKFVLGYTKAGIIQLVLTFLSCGIASVVPFVEGIIYLIKTDEEFYQTYQVGKREWF